VKIVFFGSPDFALPALEALRGAGHEIVLVVSQPAKPVGRSGRLTDPPVAARAKELGLATFQPPTLKEPAARAPLAAATADLLVVVAYGKILPQAVLDLPRLGCVNVHGSLLPRWRGASPVQAALLAGDVETGVSIMRMDAGMDTGPVWKMERTQVGPEEDAAALSARLAGTGARLLVETLPLIASGAEPTPQPVEGATLCPKIRREDGRADFQLSADELVRRARAFSPWPGLFAFRGASRVKLDGVRSVDASGEPGRILEAGERVVVACGSGAVSVAHLQAEGRRLLPAVEFVRGERLAIGELLS
jgi:methionyl-tRNA formyltransferase